MNGLQVGDTHPTGMLSCLVILNIFTTRKRSLGQGNVFRSMCQEFCPWEGEYLGRYSPGRYTLPGRYPLGPGTPPPGPGTSPQDQVHPPGTRYPIPRQVPLSQGRYTPGTRYTPRAVHAGRYGQQAAWYASYWNAFLLGIKWQETI